MISIIKKWLNVICRSANGSNSPSYIDDRASSVGGGYATQLEPLPHEEHNSRQLDTGYARQLPRDDDDDGGGDDSGSPALSVSALQLRSAPFGGIRPRRYRSEYGRRPSTLLTSAPNEPEDDDKVPSIRVESDDPNQASGGQDGVDLKHPDSNDERYVSLRDDVTSEDLSISSSKSRQSPFGGIHVPPRCGDVFGAGPSTWLTGSQGFISGSVSADDARTSIRRGRRLGSGRKATASPRIKRGASLLSSWRSRRQTSQDRVEVEMSGIGPADVCLSSLSEFSVDKKDSGGCSSDRESDVSDRSTKQLPPPSLHSENTEDSN